MKRVKFVYFKEDEGAKEYDVLSIKDMERYIEGFSVKGMDPVELQKLLDIQEKYEKALEPYMKYYRKFIKDRLKETK